MERSDSKSRLQHYEHGSWHKITGKIQQLAGGRSLQLAPRSTTEHHRLPQISRNQSAIACEWIERAVRRICAPGTAPRRIRSLGYQGHYDIERGGPRGRRASVVRRSGAVYPRRYLPLEPTPAAAPRPQSWRAVLPCGDDEEEATNHERCHETAGVYQLCGQPPAGRTTTFQPEPDG